MLLLYIASFHNVVNPRMELRRIPAIGEEGLDGKTEKGPIRGLRLPVLTFTVCERLCHGTAKSNALHNLSLCFVARLLNAHG